MGHYDDEKVRLVSLQAKKQKQSDLLNPSLGSQTIVIKESSAHGVYIDDGQTSSITDASVVHTYTGTGGAKAAVADWRSNNSSVTSGNMFTFWQTIDAMSTDAIAADRTAFNNSVTSITADLAHIQKIIDNDGSTTTQFAADGTTYVSGLDLS